MSLPVYPDLPIDVSSRVVRIRDGRASNVTVDGTIVLTLAHENERYDIRLVHSWLVAARWAELLAFYEDNRYTSFLFEFDGAERVWKFSAKPLWVWSSTSQIYRTYTVDLMEV